MDIVLWRIKIKEGKEKIAQEWIDFLKANKEEGNKTLKDEKENLEVYFMNIEKNITYIYIFILANDLNYAAEVAKNSNNPLDAKHMEYMSACVDEKECVQMNAVLPLGDFSVFEQK